METIKLTLDDSNKFRIGVPITKVNKERRTVSGFATLDNVDKHGDRIDADGSRRAFEKFRGNIREMHMPIAVGKMVSFESRPFVAEDGETYEGIWVEARVSKGAQDTWEKVLDETLTGFSIGATANKEDIEVQKSNDGTPFRLIKNYELFELSLVDSPANPLANLFSIEKADDGSTTVSGLAVDAAQETKEQEDEELITKFMDRVASFIEKRIGGNDMSDKVTDKSVETDEEIVEKAADVSEVEVETPETPAFDEDKIVDSIVEKVLERLSSVEETTDEVVTEDENVEKAQGVVESDDVDADDEDADADEDEGEDTEDDVENEVVKALTAITETLKSLGDTVTSVKEGQDSLSDRVESLEDSTAVKKSAEVEDDEDEVVEKFWGGSFTGKKLSVDSV